MEERRRAFLTEPGEPLILAHSALALVDRFSQFALITGLDNESISTSPLLAIPLPLRARGAGPRGWPTTLDPAVMWHPLFWLPERVAMRYRLDDEGEAGIETEDEWLIRVGLEVTLSGLYNPVDGTWIDVLSVLGLDSEEPAVQQRVADWLSGRDDDLLDTVDLSEVLDQEENLHWAVESSAELLPALRPASWAIIANDLAQHAGTVAVEAETFEEARSSVETLVHLALGTLRDVPGLPGVPEPKVRWEEIVRDLPAAAADLDSLIDGVLDELSESFYAIRDDYWPFVEALNEEIADQSTDASAA